VADDEMTYDALVDLKKSIDKQIELQEDANNLMRRMITVLAENSQELLELRTAGWAPSAPSKG